MCIRHLFLQDKANQVIHIRNNNQGISRQSGSIHPITGQCHVHDQRKLIIANTHIAAEMFYVGSINQIDLYPTMLDMFGLQSEWRGMGHSLLRKGYNNTISDTQRRISNNILRGGLRLLQR